MCKVGGVRKLKEAHHALFQFACTLILRKDIFNLNIEILTSTINVFQDQSFLILNELLVLRPWELGLFSWGINENRCCHILHDSLNKVKLERVLWTIFLVSCLSTIDYLLNVSYPLAKVLSNEARADISLLEVTNSECFHACIGVIVAEAEELVIMKIINDSTLTMIHAAEIADLALLDLHARLKIKEVYRFFGLNV